MSLKQVRTKLHMTQAEAAQHFGISRRSFQNYENNSCYRNSIKYKYMLEKLSVMLEDKSQRVLTLAEIKEECQKIFPAYQVDYCYLFGSYAKGKAKIDSDIDLLVATDVTGLKFFALVEELREALRKNVDVLNFEQLEGNSVLLNEILRDGIKIYG